MSDVNLDHILYKTILVMAKYVKIEILHTKFHNCDTNLNMTYLRRRSCVKQNKIQSKHFPRSLLINDDGLQAKIYM